MNQGVQTRSFFILFACCAMALLGAAGPAHAASDHQYHTILDFTQGNSLNVLISNTQATSSARTYPYVGSDVNPYAIINPNYFPSGATKPNPDLYVHVLMSNSDVQNNSLTTATLNTCDQSDPTKCPSSGVPTTYVHRLGTYSSSGGGTVTPLLNNKLAKVTMPNGTTAKAEVLNNMFTKNGQAFDMDRLRFAANRLWYEWYKEKVGAAQPGNWAARFNYQPTGTMSFENFVNNIVNKRPMFGIVRVMVPVDTQYEGCPNKWGGTTWIKGDMFMDVNQPIDGNEFSTTHTWNGKGTCSSSPHLDDYEAMYDTSMNGTQDAGTMTVYGMVLIDYIDKRTYNPNNFFNDSQDYIDNYSTVAQHDAASLTGRENVILPRSKGRNVVLMDWDNLRINPIDDLKSFVEYSDQHKAGADGRVDTLDIIRRKYMMNGVVPGTSATTAAEVSDPYVWSWWMQKALTYPVSNSTRTSIIDSLTGSGGATAQYDIANQVFTGGTWRSDFNTNEWPNLPEQDRAHAYFPSGYERGWMIAMDALRLDELDQTTVSKDPGSWWSNLTQNAIDTDGNMTTKNYNPFEMPDPNLFITADADGDGYATKMPNPFETKWEDLPALAFAGGLLDVHGNANISGMLYTPDSCEIEAHAGSEVNGDANNAGPFQYVNGALLVGNGLWLEDQRNADHSMIAVSYNYNSFNRLRSGVARLTVMKVSNIAEIKGQ